MQHSLQHTSGCLILADLSQRLSVCRVEFVCMSGAHIRVFSTEGLSAVQHLVNEHAQGIHITAGAGRLPLQHFRSHPERVAALPQPVHVNLHTRNSILPDCHGMSMSFCQIATA